MNFEAIGKVTFVFFCLIGIIKTIEFIYNRLK